MNLKIKVMKKNIKFPSPVTEMCSACMNEVNVSELVSKCPECGEEIVACGQCTQCLDGGNGCGGCAKGSNFKGEILK